MRSQNRSFVVEVKSSRKRLSKPQKSIWGDTDLKAIAREVDCPTFTTTLEPPALAEEEKAATSQEDVRADAHFNTVSVQAPADSMVDASEKHSDQTLTTSTESTEERVRGARSPSYTPSVPRPPLRRRLAKTAKTAGHSDLSSKTKRSKNKAAKITTIQGRQKFSAAYVPDMDELAELENENRDLRRQLADKLRAENDFVRSLLNRI